MPGNARPEDAGPRGAPSTDGWEALGIQLRYVRELAARPGRTAPWPAWLTVRPEVLTAVGRAGVAAPWVHQVQAASALWEGRHVTVTTGTASGKSLAYLLPIMASVTSPTPGTDAAFEGGGAGGVGPGWPRRRRPATSLYLAPTKALAHDQARVCAELELPGWRVAVVDGDTDPAERQWARDHAHHLLTSPDLLHASLLPGHQRWATWLRSLRFIVVDESHQYRGVFGAQVAAVLRRLRRVAAHYRADPTVAVLSATATESLRTAADLTGLPADGFTLVEEDTSDRGPIRLRLAVAETGPEDAAAALLAERVRSGRQVLAFVPSRRRAEEVARAAARAAGDRRDILAYRAGYLAADRRLIERGLADRTVRGVAATNALELGVDVAGLDTVLLCGYPGSRTAFWQQAGRAGRRGGEAEVVLLARPSPLDAYLLDHPDALLDQPVEVGVLDPGASAVLGPQLAVAAQELPLRPGDEHWFGPATWPLVERLTAAGVLRRRPDGWYWTAPHRAAAAVNLRSGDGRSVEIVEEPTGRVLGSVALGDADRVLHPGAVYVHQGDGYLCEGVDEQASEAFVRAARPRYLTQPVVESEVHLGPADRQRGLGRGWLAYGTARVSSSVTGFLRCDELSGRVWDRTPLDLPERTLATSLTALTVPAGLVDGPSRVRLDAGGHALEHLCAGLLPAIVANDRFDVGAGSWIAEDGGVVIVVYDRRPGSGFAARAYERAEVWLRAAQDRIVTCPCATGCPSCILAPDCVVDRALDKAYARRLLDTLRLART